MNFIFWANIYSPHLLPMIRSLAAGEHSVTIVVERTMSPQRAALGWAEPDLGGIRGLVAPDTATIEQLVREAPAETIHIIAGVRFRDLGQQAMAAIRAHKARWGILSESADPRGWAGRLRRLKYLKERCTLGRSMDFVLAMGETGLRWFRAAGYPAEKVFEFAYTVDAPGPIAEAPEEAATRLLFVGQMIDRKGVDTLLQACARIEGDYRLRLIGSGAEKDKFRQLAAQLGVAQHCGWTGALPSENVRQAMAAADCLILPSYHDGWGAVVNEALMVGLPVVCSRQCGASALIGDASRGAVFQAGDADGLAEAIQQTLRQPSGQRKQARTEIQEWAQILTGASMAGYFINLMQHLYEEAPRPNVPWKA